MTLKPIANVLQVERKVEYEKGMVEKVHENVSNKVVFRLFLAYRPHYDWRGTDYRQIWTSLAQKHV